jgi:predicted GNAT superfamily acetyltransferase
MDWVSHWRERSDRAAAGTAVHALTTGAELTDLRELFDLAWPSPSTQITQNFGTALIHSGAVLTGVYQDHQLVAGAMAIVSNQGGKVGLHSHMAATHPDFRGRGFGALVKYEQAAIAAAQGIRTITWTFDPLVLRNAKLNVLNLGVTIKKFVPDFYGQMEDEINANDLTDRLWCEWQLEQPKAMTAPHQPLPISDDLIRVPIVKDIGAIKNVDPKQARELRLDMRNALSNALDGTREIKGISPADEYLIGNI